jgi:hypothetical protein
VGAYVKTTSTINSAPRFNHDPTTGESLGLLVEESRTNLIIKSEELDDAAWTKGGSTISANAIAAPTGTTTADKIAEDNSNSSHRVISTAPSWAGSTAYTYSFYAKADERTLVYGLIGTTVVASRLLVIFDLSTGVVTTSSGSPTSTSMTNVGGGWYRCSITFTSIASPSGGVVAGIWSATEVYTGTAGSGIYLWGAQLEAGSFPTSYIPTTTATVTRAADVASTSGSNFSSWYNQSEGTLFADSQTPYPVATGKFPTPISITDGTTSDNHFAVGFLTEVLASSLVENNNTNATPNYMSPLSGVRRRKISIAVADNDAFAVTNGTLTSPKVNNILLPRNHAEAIIGGNLSYNSMNGTIRRLTYWPTRLPNEVLQTITQ